MEDRSSTPIIACIAGVIVLAVIVFLFGNKPAPQAPVIIHDHHHRQQHQQMPPRVIVAPPPVIIAPPPPPPPRPGIGVEVGPNGGVGVQIIR